jgi:hypothetical protein
VVGVIATLMASIRPDREDAGRLHVLAATQNIPTVKAKAASR